MKINQTKLIRLISANWPKEQWDVHNKFTIGQNENYTIELVVHNNANTKRSGAFLQKIAKRDECITELQGAPKKKNARKKLSLAAV